MLREIRSGRRTIDVRRNLRKPLEKIIRNKAVQLDIANGTHKICGLKGGRLITNKILC